MVSRRGMLPTQAQFHVHARNSSPPRSDILFIRSAPNGRGDTSVMYVGAARAQWSDIGIPLSLYHITITNSPCVSAWLVSRERVAFNAIYAVMQCNSAMHICSVMQSAIWINVSFELCNEEKVTLTTIQLVRWLRPSKRTVTPPTGKNAVVGLLRKGSSCLTSKLRYYIHVFSSFYISYIFKFRTSS